MVPGSIQSSSRKFLPIFSFLRTATFILAGVTACGIPFGAVAGAQETHEKPEWCRQLPRREYSRLERIAVANDWFEVYKVAPGVLAIYEPHQSEETIGYLIEGRKRALLFDTGMGIGDLRSLVGKLSKLPVIVLNSHTHDDHVGNNWQFDEVYGMDNDYTRHNARGSKEDAQAEIAPGEVCGALPAGFDPATYATRPWQITKWVHDGDRIDLGERSMDVIATPGHTPDSICLFDRANGLLFTGDTYYPGTVWIYRPETDLTAYGNSVRRIAALGPQVKLVLGAHNIPIAQPVVLNELASAFAQMRAGLVRPRPAGKGKVIYQVGGISFLMRTPTDVH